MGTFDKNERQLCTLLQKSIYFSIKVLKIESSLMSVFYSLAALKNVDWFLSVIPLSQTTGLRVRG